MTFLQEGKTNWKYISIIAILAILVGGGTLFYQYWTQKEETTKPAFVLTPSKEVTPSEETQENLDNFLFITRGEIKEDLDKIDFKALIYDIADKKVVISKNIEFKPEEGMIASSSTAEWGVNNSVQYNVDTNDIFFLTESLTGMGGCYGTCDARIHKTNFKKDSSEVIFKTTDLPSQWIMSPSHNTIFISFHDKGSNKQNIKKIDIDTKKTSDFITISFNDSAHFELSKLVLSTDERYIFQAYTRSIGKNWEEQTIYLNKINIENGTVEKIEIYKGQGIEFDTSISPDNRYFSFYAIEQPDLKLFVFDLSTKKLTSIPYVDEITNYNLLWSRDSKKILYIAGNQMAYYNIEESKDYMIEAKTTWGIYPLSWGSNNYILFSAPQENIKFYDINSKEVFVPELNFFQKKSHPSEVAGTSWFE